MSPIRDHPLATASCQLRHPRRSRQAKRGTWGEGLQGPGVRPMVKRRRHEGRAPGEFPSATGQPAPRLPWRAGPRRRARLVDACAVPAGYPPQGVELRQSRRHPLSSRDWARSQAARLSSARGAGTIEAPKVATERQRYPCCSCSRRNRPYGSGVLRRIDEAL